MNGEYVTLGEIATLQAGFGFPLNLQGRKKGLYPFAKVGDISRCGRTGNSVLSTTDHYIDQADIEKLRAKPVPAGSVLFAKIGEAIKQNHRVVAGCNMLLDNNAMAAIPGTRVDGRFLYNFLKTVDFYCLAPATTVPALRKSDLERLSIRLPILSEQCRIAAILDKADALRAKRREALEQLESLTQSIFIEMFGDRTTNPKGFPKLPISDVTEISTGSTPSRGEEGYFDGVIPWLKTTEVEGEPIWNTQEKLTEAGFKAIRGKLHPVNSIIVAMYGQGQTRGRCCLLKVEAACNQACGVIRPSHDFDSNFMFCQLRLAYDELRALGRGGNQENLNLQLLGSFKILLPPLALQQTFATRIQVVNTLKTAQRAAQSELNALFATLQHRAFRGEL